LDKEGEEESLHLLLVEDESGGVGEGVVLLHDGEG